jgi:hypothetical protein
VEEQSKNASEAYLSPAASDVAALQDRSLRSTFSEWRSGLEWAPGLRSQPPRCSSASSSSVFCALCAFVLESF